MRLITNIIKEPIRILADTYYFFNTGFKKPVSFLFNFFFPYQYLRIKIDSYLTDLYQKKFLKLEKNPLKKKQLEKMRNDGIIKIENFHNFENSELLVELIKKKKRT